MVHTDTFTQNSQPKPTSQPKGQIDCGAVDVMVGCAANPAANLQGSPSQAEAACVTLASKRNRESPEGRQRDPACLNRYSPCDGELTGCATLASKRSDQGFLPPIPGLSRQDPEHRYLLTRPGQPDRHFPVSITGVLAVMKSAYAMERIEATRAVWEPRGNTCHLALETFLQGRLDELEPLAAGEYADWVVPLITHPRWAEVEVIASERPTCCLRRNISGTYDCGLVEPGGRRVLADLKSLGESGSTYSTAAQLGGYMALEATWGIHYDAGQTIWARPGKTTWSPLYSRSECLAAWAAAWATYRALQGAPDRLSGRILL